MQLVVLGEVLDLGVCFPVEWEIRDWDVRRP